jgi:hypothetical protein
MLGGKVPLIFDRVGAIRALVCRDGSRRRGASGEDKARGKYEGAEGAVVYMWH